MPTSENKVDFRQLLERLHDPLRLRVLVTGLMLVVGYAAIYTPLNGSIEETTRKLAEEHRRQDLANETDRLRTQVAKFQPRLPSNTDTNEWVQYLLDGIRKFPLKLVTLDSDPTQRVGPYKAIVLQVELEGGFNDLDLFLHWLEGNERLIRVDSARIAPARGKTDKLVMQLTLLGLRG